MYVRNVQLTLLMHLYYTPWQKTTFTSLLAWISLTTVTHVRGYRYTITDAPTLAMHGQTFPASSLNAGQWWSEY